MVSHLGEAYTKFSFPQSQRSAPPCQLQLTSSRQAEFVICDQTIDESFRDCKDLLHLPKAMNKRQDYLEKMIALVLIAFVVGYLFGEAVRDVCYGKLEADQVTAVLLGEVPEQVSANRKWHLYSGLFILLKQKPRLPDETLFSIAKSVAQVFPKLVYGPVRSFV